MSFPVNFQLESLNKERPHSTKISLGFGGAFLLGILVFGILANISQPFVGTTSFYVMRGIEVGATAISILAGGFMLHFIDQLHFSLTKRDELKRP